MHRSIVTINALVKRINRKLAHEGAILRKARTWNTDTLTWYVVDDRNCVTSAHDDLADLARQLKVMGEWETIESEVAP